MVKTRLLYLARKYPFFATAKRTYQSIRDTYYRLLPVNEKVIVFESFRSTKYADSPKAIYEYLLANDEYKDYKFVWVFEHPERYIFLEEDQRTTIVKHESAAYYRAFARSKYWVVNGWIPLRLQKKQGQIALQCWHGTPLKRLRYDIDLAEATEHQMNALKENDQDMVRYDYFISPSKFATDAFTSAFNLKELGKDSMVIETGYPRNDALVKASEQDRDVFRKKYKIPKGKKVVLYAPTWRDDQGATGGGYQYVSPVNFDFLQEQLGKEWVILFRSHNLAKNMTNFSKYEDFIRDVSDVDDINELYIASDVLITDYSSVFFDYANLHRPLIFYMYDREHYQSNLRGFYLDINDLPGDIVETEEQLVRSLRGVGKPSVKREEMYKKFHDTYNYLDDGNATKRVVEKVLQRGD